MSDDNSGLFDEKVYIIVPDEYPRYEPSKRHHKRSCYSVVSTTNNVITMNEARAIELGHEPCTWCGPEERDRDYDSPAEDSGGSRLTKNGD